MTIKRLWHGWTTPENAAKYRNLLNRQILRGIEAKKIPGYRSIEVLSRELGDEIEFVTIMTFDSLECVIDFQGADYARCYVPDAAKAVLKRWDQIATHYETVETREY